MSEQQSTFEKAVALIDAANSEDPNQETVEGKTWPKELLYSHRMSSAGNLHATPIQWFESVA